jgi:hypothetical protein
MPILPQNEKSRDIFINIFRSVMSNRCFSPVEKIKDLRLQDEDDIRMIEALSALRYYCVVYSASKWQIRPTVVEKYNNGHYEKIWKM